MQLFIGSRLKILNASLSRYPEGFGGGYGTLGFNITRRGGEGWPNLVSSFRENTGMHQSCKSFAIET